MSPTQRSRSVREDGNRRCMHVCPDLVSHVTRIGAVLAGTCLLLSGLAVVAVSNAAGAARITHSTRPPSLRVWPHVCPPPMRAR